MTTESWHEGGCHCGGVRFRVRLRGWKATRCNCSMCRKRQNLHVIVPPEDFELLRGEDVLREYRFNTGVAVHRFCGTCGIHPFYTPRSHPDKVDVNAYCLDDVPVESFAVHDFDGREWEKHVHELR